MNNKSWQSAVSGIQAENISIGDINQSIINSSNARYNHIGVIISEYNKNAVRLERSFRDKSRANQKNMYKELQNRLKNLHQQVEVYQEEIEEHEKEIRRIDKIGGYVINKQIEDDDGIFNKNDLFGNIKDAVIPGFSAYIFQEAKKQKREKEAELEETKQDIRELKHLIPLVEGFLRMDSLELDIDQILDNESLAKLSSCVRDDIESIKDNYRSQQGDIEDSYEEELDRYRVERNISVYREELQYCVDEDGYPLSSSKMRFLEARLRGFNLAQEDVESISEEIIRPLAVENLEKYEVAYQDKLRQDGFPPSENSVKSLQELRENLGLNAFGFLQLATQSIEEDLVRPFYQTNLQEYQRNYREKLEEKGLALETEDITQLDALQIRLGLKTFVFPGFDVKKTEQELVELVYQENIQKFEREYKQKLAQEGFPLSLNTISELNCLEKTLGLGSFQFPDCSDPLSIKKELVEPLYQANLQAYSEEFRRKLYQFGINFSQKNTSDLDNLRRSLGLDSYYLENLGLPDLFNLEEINNIETELIELVYRENLQSYEQQYKQKLGEEGFFLSYPTISELTHLEEILGLESFKAQDDPGLKSIKARWIRPFYQVNLQSYSKEYKRKLYQVGLDFAENHKLELEKMRGDFGLTSTHLKNLNLQGQFFLLESDLFTLEKIARESFYIESLQCYAQEIKRKLESNDYSSGDSSLIESLQALGIRNEDIKIVEGLTRNNCEIDHLFHERDGDASYWKLLNSLEQREWQKADALTRELLLKLAGRSSKGFLDKEAIEKTTARDVYTLDLLWVEYSKEHFGFSVQKKIYEQVDRKKQPFAEAVGWSNQAGIFGIFAWKSYNELDFTINAPKGHLPVWRVKGKEISVDDFSHLKIWHFKDNEPKLESLVDANGSKPDSSTTNILSQSFQKIFESINQFEIKQKVDKMGIDGFINQCAILAATTGAASGFGGFATMIVGVPFDVLNNVLQQFRVTLGVIYHKKGVYKVSFAELITIVGVSIGVEVGATLTKSVMINIANKILVQLSASTAGKAVPFLGAAIGGSVNYGFVRAIGAAVKRIDMSTYKFQSEEEKQ
jgi:hypothetical protein